MENTSLLLRREVQGETSREVSTEGGTGGDVKNVLFYLEEVTD